MYALYRTSRAVPASAREGICNGMLAVSLCIPWQDVMSGAGLISVKSVQQCVRQAAVSSHRQRQDMPEAHITIAVACIEQHVFGRLPTRECCGAGVVLSGAAPPRAQHA